MKAITWAALAIAVAGCTGGRAIDAPRALVVLPNCVRGCVVTVETVTAGTAVGDLSTSVSQRLETALGFN